MGISVGVPPSIGSRKNCEPSTFAYTSHLPSREQSGKTASSASFVRFEPSASERITVTWYWGKESNTTYRSPQVEDEPTLWASGSNGVFWLPSKLSRAKSLPWFRARSFPL